MQHKNFYETPQECTIRLRGTIVLYDGVPFNVIAVTNHKTDGIFRIYMEPVGPGYANLPSNKVATLPSRMYPPEYPPLGDLMDTFIETFPQYGIVRKFMTSSGFNKFRPFPLGMVNADGRTYYTERTPIRSTPQGLNSSMVREAKLTLIPNHNKVGKQIDIYGAPFRATIVGDYPDIKTCIDKLKDPKVENDSVGFDRMFALMRGPMDTLFLAYKEQIIGVLVNGDTSVLRLAPKHVYAKEVCSILGVFNDIIV